jgi:hypothetical protein
MQRETTSKSPRQPLRHDGFPIGWLAAWLAFFVLPTVLFGIGLPTAEDPPRWMAVVSFLVALIGCWLTILAFPCPWCLKEFLLVVTPILLFVQLIAWGVAWLLTTGVPAQ